MCGNDCRLASCTSSVATRTDRCEFRTPIGDSGFSISSGATPEADHGDYALHRYLQRRATQPWFANARSVSNAVERARLRHARRLISAPNQLVNLAALVNPAGNHQGRTDIQTPPRS
ncbi:hypothetical protein [Nocardia sp. NPDC005998]|uniref:hypothetical protein n=1 Tax=Nocardia sp. NPDC005998 TaxID=3156894 RepID=UPI0033BE0DFE